LQHHIKLSKPESDNDYWMMNLSESRYLKKKNQNTTTKNHTKPNKSHNTKKRVTDAISPYQLETIIYHPLHERKSTGLSRLFLINSI